MNMKTFFKGMFSETADVDYFPPESQNLVEDPAAPAATTTSATEENAGGLLSLEEQQTRESAATMSVDNAGVGLTDGYQAWTQSFEAFHQAIGHTLFYFALGILAYSFLLDTKWPIVDAVYFSVVIFTTVGYGDLCPRTTQGEIFTIFFAIYGIIILGIFLGVLGDMLVERQQKQKQDNMENARRKYLQNFQHGTYQQGKHPTLTSTNQTIPAEPSSFRKFIESFKIYFNICLNQMWVMVFLFAVAIPVILIEKWDFVKGIYWMVITGTTIGLGDETPTQPISKALCIVYIPVAVYSVGRFLGLVATTFLDQRSQKAEEKFLSRALTLSDIDRMDFDNDGGVSREEFLIYMLVTLQKVEQEDVNEIMDVFRKLDKTGDGVLDADDLAAEIKRANEITSGMRSGVS